MQRLVETKPTSPPSKGRHFRNGDFPRPRQVKPAVPPALEAVCLKAMALRPEDRYSTAQDLAADVEHWLADEPVSAYGEPWPVRAGRWMRRHRPLVAGAAVLKSTPGVDATRLANEEADRAIAWLKQAVTAGYKDVGFAILPAVRGALQ